jgi:hypothetical protein
LRWLARNDSSISPCTIFSNPSPAYPPSPCKIPATLLSPSFDVLPPAAAHEILPPRFISPLPASICPAASWVSHGNQSSRPLSRITRRERRHEWCNNAGRPSRIDWRPAVVGEIGYFWQLPLNIGGSFDDSAAQGSYFWSIWWPLDSGRR